MTKLTLENYFTTELLTEVDDSIVWEIEYQLAVEPQSDFWYLIIDYLDPDLREEIFYHRKAWTSVFQYWVNRQLPKVHAVSASVQLNDSASIFNYITNLLPDHFFMYKTWASTMFIKGWKLYDDWVYYTIPNKSDLVFLIWTNYLYIEDQVIKSTTDSITDKLIFGDVIVDWVWEITSFNNYNTLALVTSRTNKILRGTWVPLVSLWIDWDYYIDDENKTMYWPKSWDWWTSFSIRWPQWLEWPIWPKWEPWDIWEAWPLTVLTGWDNILWDTAVINYPTDITVTDWNGYYVVYTPTDISYYTDEDVLYKRDTIVWVWNVEETALTYDWDISYIDWTTWVATITWEFAYVNKVYEFREANKFNEPSIFKNAVVCPSYWDLLTNWTNVDWLNWSKQYLKWDTNQELTMSNIIMWQTMMLVIDNVHTGTIELSLWIFWKFGWGWFTTYSIGWTTYPLSLPVGLNVFIMEAFTTWVHISYIWQSITTA